MSFESRPITLIIVDDKASVLFNRERGKLIAPVYALG